MHCKKLFLSCFLVLFSMTAFAVDPGIEAIKLVTNEDGSQTYSVTLQILGLMTALAFLPAILMMMTSFTRTIIVFSILRQALGLQQAPSNQIILGLTLFLTFFIMSPVLDKVNEIAIQPYINEELAPLDAVKKASEPFREFMLAQPREAAIALFVRISGAEYQSIEELPFTVLMPAFVTSELKTAFQIGFLLFLPFLIIDMVVACVLMTTGMMMLSPMIISLPFKIMFFVLMDGWTLVMGSLAGSFSVSVIEYMQGTEYDT